jgi:putative tryptophan/tyrosine transport system substrate-binding protein
MRRREFIELLGGTVLAWPASVSAQSISKVPCVGVLSPGNPPPLDPFHQAENFEAGLRELGWQPSANITIKYRYAEGRLERLPAMAAELVGLNVDVIVARGQTLDAARNATGSIPIVMAFDPDPMGNGYIQSLARPGGNITGLTTQAVELEAKWLTLLVQAIPSLTRVGYLTKASNAASKTEQDLRREAAARTLRLEVVPITVDKADQLPAVFATIKDTRAGAILVSQTLYFVDLKAVATLALQHRVAAIGSQREFAEAGPLMAYGANIADLHRRVASYVDKIFKGATPANLPVEQPTRFEFVINARTAKALGLAIPLILLTFADEVIE